MSMPSPAPNPFSPGTASGGPAIMYDLRRHLSIFNLDQNHLGEDLLDIVAAEILIAMDAEVDMDGVAWPALSDRPPWFYATWKAQHFPGQPMAVLHGLMKTTSNIMGERAIRRDNAESTFGHPGDVARDEAEWFQEGRSTSGGGQPPRPFYFFGQKSIDKADDFLKAHFSRLV